MSFIFLGDKHFSIVPIASMVPIIEVFPTLVKHFLKMLEISHFKYPFFEPVLKNGVTQEPRRISETEREKSKI